jgi:hypothetical protein
MLSLLTSSKSSRPAPKLRSLRVEPLEAKVLLTGNTIPVTAPGNQPALISTIGPLIARPDKTTYDQGASSPVAAATNPGSLVTGAAEAVTGSTIRPTFTNSGAQTMQPDPAMTTLDIQESSIESNSIVVTWTSSVALAAYIEYGLSDTYGLSTILDTGVFRASDTVAISGLMPGTTYHYQLVGEDSLGNVLASADRSFTTTSPSILPSSTLSGGLTEYPVPMLGADLLTNAGFENVANNTPVGWTSNGFVPDTTLSQSGTASYRITDANTIPYGQFASQSIHLAAGSYRISGWVKLQGMTLPGSGVRLSLVADGANTGSSTVIVQGTSDWQYLEKINIVVPAAGDYHFLLQCYAEPTGTAWFDDVELRQELTPAVDVYMLYPNYRGMLFDDQSQTARFNVNITPPATTDISLYNLRGDVVDEATGSVQYQWNESAVPSSVLTYDASTLATNKTYLVHFRLVTKSDSQVVYEYPAYRIAKVSGALKSSMTMSFDDNNRFLIRGQPTFILGVYDSALDYYSYGSGWNDQFVTARRLFELPINVYLNYWFGKVPAPYLGLMMNVLQQHNILYLQTGNAFADGFSRDFGIYNSDAYVEDIAQNPGLAGYYVMDEASTVFAPQIFADYQRFKALDPDSVTLGIAMGSGGYYWRDNLDIFGMDPYPLYGAEPANGFPLNKVGDWTTLTKNAVMDSRPFVTVLQFFQSTGNSRWPTTAELRNMTYMAIADGANGVFYWSLGANALAYVGTGWTDQKVAYFDSLKSVTSEISGIEPALSSIDRPDLLASNSNPSIHTRVKVVGNTVYLITYNYTNSPTSTTFGFGNDVTAVSAYNEARTIDPSGNEFSDAFGPYEAHVYIFSMAPATHTIVASPSSYGVISPPGDTTVNTGASQTYTITPNSGYRVYDVMVDGSPVGAVATYTFAGVTADHTITVTYNYAGTILITTGTLVVTTPQSSPDGIGLAIGLDATQMFAATAAASAAAAKWAMPVTTLSNTRISPSGATAAVAVRAPTCSPSLAYDAAIGSLTKENCASAAARMATARDIAATNMSSSGPAKKGAWLPDLVLAQAEKSKSHHWKNVLAAVDSLMMMSR